MLHPTCDALPVSQAAGSADAFRKVDLHYVEAAARAARAAAVPHFSLVSAQGARAGLWASDLKPLHGLLYAKTKGQVRPPGALPGAQASAQCCRLLLGADTPSASVSAAQQAFLAETGAKPVCSQARLTVQPPVPAGRGGCEGAAAAAHHHRAAGPPGAW